MSRHLVTGGAGFIGSALTHRLVREGHKVVVLDRFSRGKQERLPDRAELVRADIRDREAVRLAAMGCDTIWHLAFVQGTQTFYADPKDVIDVALGGMVSVLAACEDGKRDLILVSTSEVYQDPPAGMYPTDESVPLLVPDVTNPRYSYGGGKIAQEVATLAYSHAGVLNRGVIVRPHNIYGPDMGKDHVIPQFALRMAALPDSETKFRIQGTGRETRSFCYIDDCIDGLMVAFAHGSDGNVYHLGNPSEEYPIATLAQWVANWFGRHVDITPGELPKGSPTRRKPDVGKLAELGFRPKVSLWDGLAPTLEWYRTAEAVA